ncbi:hypothetical protein CDD83_8038 [Cordyceps sp. RAO-2017]|nr:hypothetical protein CDD83_8038 [Cordyceps sp. RAO-2017]
MANLDPPPELIRPPIAAEADLVAPQSVNVVRLEKPPSALDPPDTLLENLQFVVNGWPSGTPETSTIAIRDAVARLDVY